MTYMSLVNALNPYQLKQLDEIEVSIRKDERERLVGLVDKVIFDLPIGEDVTYSRGYSAGVAAARESLREALSADR